MTQHTTHLSVGQGSRHQSEVIADLCYRFVSPLLHDLHTRLDRRLVNTFLELLLVIVLHRHRNQGLLLSELGGFLLNAEHAPAGTKRISNLLKSKAWKSEEIYAYLWQQADLAIDQRLNPKDDVYVIWDESVIEKPESLAAERLCAVRSSKASRLKRIKPGFFNPPGGRPLFVPGFHWLQIIVTGLKGTPALAHLCFWTTRGNLKRRNGSKNTACWRNYPNAGENQSYMCGIAASLENPGWVWCCCMRFVLLFAGRRTTNWWIHRAESSKPGSVPGENGPWITG
jgi:hypothetical protein